MSNPCLHVGITIGESVAPQGNDERNAAEVATLGMLVLALIPRTGSEWLSIATFVTAGPVRRI
jgi:hypothetical protein